jgi:limonene-1,2-epoxide hydrolase
MNEYVVRGVQLFLAAVLLVMTVTRFSWNHIGQNIINFTAVGIFGVGFDNLIMLYRAYLNKQSF